MENSGIPIHCFKFLIFVKLLVTGISWKESGQYPQNLRIKILIVNLLSFLRKKKRSATFW
jgi:hypothetical protein